MAKSNKSMKFYESIIKDNTWSVNVLLKAEIDGCDLKESSKSFQIHRPIGERSLPRSCFEKWDFEAVIVARQPVLNIFLSVISQSKGHQVQDYQRISCNGFYNVVLLPRVNEHNDIIIITFLCQAHYSTRETKVYYCTDTNVNKILTISGRHFFVQQLELLMAKNTR